MTSGLFGGRAFPIPWQHKDEVRHRRLIAEGVNFTAAAAFSPETKIAVMEDPLALTGSFVSALEVSVTPFVPARAHLLYFLYLVNTGGSPLAAQFRLVENGVVLRTYTLPSVAGTEELHVPVQYLRELLLPNTTYTYAIEATATGGTTGDLNTSSSLSVRVEHRVLVP